MAQKPVLRGEVGCACVAREVNVERGGMGPLITVLLIFRLLKSHYPIVPLVPFGVVRSVAQRVHALNPTPRSLPRGF